jgi:hypothetical protein
LAVEPSPRCRASLEFHIEGALGDELDLHLANALQTNGAESSARDETPCGAGMAQSSIPAHISDFEPQGSTAS